MEQKYRGLVIDEPNEWVYGTLIDDDMICQEQENSDSRWCGIGIFKIDEMSLGKCSRYKDMNNIDIYENDIVKRDDTNELYEVEYWTYIDTFRIVNINSREDIQDINDYIAKHLTIVGNDSCTQQKAGFGKRGIISRIAALFKK